VRQLRRYALTGERFGAEEAVRIGLAHKMVPLAELEAEGAIMVDHVLANGPDAIAETKAWILRSTWSDIDAQTGAALVDSHAKKRQSAEAAEGLASFAEKRAGRWQQG
jgi:methylglutaconyl-CoA hydratase